MKIGNVTVGTLIPTFASAKHQTQVPTLQRFAQHAEALGFDSIWVLDHYVKAPVYGQSWLDPLVALAYVASQTRRVKLGTSVLVAPVRDPVMLAKQVASLEFFSGERFILGVGPGWNPLEFEAVQVPLKERGRRLDEIIEILRRLLSRPTASFEGRYYRFPEIAIEPLPSRPTPIWVGGGSRPGLVGDSGPSVPPPDRVIQRIARADGWSCIPQTPPALLANDWARIQDAARAIGRDPSEITFANMQYVHVVDTDDRERAYQEQRRFFGEYVGEARPWSYVQACYLVGSITDIVANLRARMAVGVHYFMLGPVTSDPRELERQLELLVAKVLPQLA